MRPCLGPGSAESNVRCYPLGMFADSVAPNREDAAPARHTLALDVAIAATIGALIAVAGQPNCCTTRVPSLGSSLPRFSASLSTR